MLSKNTKRFLKNLLLLGALCGARTAQAQLPAFPGAEGAGMYTSGGRGTPGAPTTVFEVTHLNDDNNPGSLRYALTAAATHRTVVFRVSGTIHLTSNLGIRANTTIAGQTAPGDGICVADYPVSISGDNVVLRYLRFRLGDRHQKVTDAGGNPVNGSGGGDALGGLGPSNILIDHCSVSWSADEALTIYRGDNLTIQWCLVSEPLNYSYHFETGDTDYERHGYGGIWGGKRASLHHNLIAHVRNRAPRFSGISTYTPSTPGVENVDFRNNVLYNWGINNVYGGEGGNYNVVNNFYKYGPNTGSGVRYRICNPSNSATVPFGKWWVSGNYVDGSSSVTADNWTGVAIDDVSWVMPSGPLNHGYPVKTQTAADAYAAVLAGAGCSLPNRDTLDQRIVNDVKNRTGGIIDVQGGYPHGTPYEQTVNAWPALASAPAPADGDHDGMPDGYESAHGLNAADASDRSGIAANGYTHLENYLNSLTSPAAATDPVVYATTAFSSFKQTTGAASAPQTFPVSGTNLAGAISLTAPAGYQLSTDGTSWSSSLSLNPVSGTVASTTVSVRLNAAAIGSYGGVIEVTSAGTPTLTFAVSGATADPVPVVINQKQVIGLFPLMEGGFENQPAGAVSTTAPGAGVNLLQTVWTTNGSANIVANGTARTGANYFTYTSTSGSVKSAMSPTVTGTLFSNNTKYIVQYYYRTPAPATGNAVGGQLSVADNTNLTSANSTAAYAGTNGAWVKASFSYGLNPAYTATMAFGGLRFNGGGSALVRPFDVDDYVVYPADNQASPAADVTAPDAPASATATGNYENGTISLGWTAPATGLDGGGYLVVRSTSATAPVLTPNGLYSLGNSPAAGVVVVYLGKTAGFTDDGSVAALASGTTYYYHVFTADKAFNYSAAATASGAVTVPVATVSLSGSLAAFGQTVGAPSAAQRFSLSGSNLNGKVTLTAPTGFELSEDENAWSSSLLLTPENKSLNLLGFLRLNAPAAGSYSGALSAASAGATAATLPVSGTTTVVYQVQVYTAANADVVVAKDGSGQYASIQQAINAAPVGRTTPYVIFIKNGKYVEKINIPSNKPFIHLVGESVAGTVISWDAYSGKVENGVNIGTNTSATLTVNASDFFMMSVTVENATGYVGDGPQALAIYISGDRCVYKNCRFIGGQDTVWHNGNGRHLFKNCYIDGNTDFIFGSSTALFDSCVIYGRDRLDGGGGGYVTAANTPSALAYGEVFRDCRMPANRGVTSYSLGRPWGNAPKTVYINTRMGSSVSPAGWSTWSVDTALITYAEYKSRKWDGSPVDVSKRLSWSKQLTDEQAAPYYNNNNLFGAWDPYYAFPALNAPVPAELAVANFRTQRNSSNVTLSWNLSWPISGVKFELFRSSDSVHFTKVNELTGGVDSVVAFSLTDALPAKGTVYYYYVKASKSGYASTSSYTGFIDPSIPLNGDTRSRASGNWTNNGTASIWEKYNSGTKAWEPLALGTGASGNVTVATGDTVVLNSLVGINNLTIEKDGVLQADVLGKNLRIKGDIYNAGVFGGTDPAANKITLELDGTNGVYQLGGDGRYQFNGIRALTGVSNITLNINSNLVLSGGLQAWYGSNNSTWDYGTNDVTVNVQPGVTVQAGFLHTASAGDFVVRTVGKYTYNIAGTLDLSGSAMLSALVPHKTIAQPITLNVTGTLKLGKLFSTNTAPVAGSLSLNIGNGGLVDASKATTFTTGSHYFATTGSGALKRQVSGTATSFPIGTAGSYNPVTLTNSGTADNFSVRVQSTFDQPVADASKVVNRQWTISEEVAGGSNVTAKFGWQAADKAAAFDPSGLLAIMQYAGGSWNNTAASPGGSGTTADPYTATASGLTSFAPFGVTNYDKVPATIRLQDTTITYDAQPHGAAGVASGTGVEGEQLSPALTLTYKDATGTLLQSAPVQAGTYSITASFAGNAFYLPASASATLTISPRPLTIKAGDQTKECGTALDLGTTAFTAEGLAGADAVSSVTLSNDGAGLSGTEGNYDIAVAEARGTGLTNYSISYVTGTLAVTDGTAPVVTYLPEVPVLCYRPDGVYTIPALAATDNCSTVGISYRISGATSRSGSGANASGSFNEGVSTITWTISDDHGHENTVQTTVTVNPRFTAGIPDVYALNQAVDAKNTLYLGYGPATLGLEVLAQGGTAPYTFGWSTGATTPSISVSAAGVYGVTVTDGNGCVAAPAASVEGAPAGQASVPTVHGSAVLEIKVMDVRCGNNNDKVRVCHNGVDICVASAAVEQHLDHGDQLGGCNALSQTPSGTMGEAAASLVQVYPNPVAETINLRISQLHAGASVQVYNAGGVQVLSQRLTNTLQSIPARGLTAGMYYVVVRNGDQTTTHKMLKQ
ncbi:pectinesterase family protein [Paraflavisolibacter sp. H34]|uniref:pectinesterase family protein n=1 Tax=Huijunlia imazamoxiresistens TaxID=3127457 RepID=UPI00301769BD